LVDGRSLNRAFFFLNRFAALNQLVSSAGDEEKMQSHLIFASDGTRLERADAGSSQFTAVALNGLVETSKLEHNKEVNFKTF
jgi:hypothetical protein